MELTLDQALQKGIEAHKVGQVQQADRLYTAILEAQPQHPDANHNMGVLAVGLGKVQEALPFLKTALEANPSKAQFWLSYIDALIKIDRLAEAKAIYIQAKGKGAKGDGFDTLKQQLEGVETAESITSNPQDPLQDQLQPLINLYNQGQLSQALDEASRLLQQFSNSHSLYNIQGAANKGLGQLDAAIDSYNRALSLKPDYADAYNNLGIALKEQGRLEEAIEAISKAISLKPDFVEAYNNMGNALQDQGELEEAIETFNKVLSLKPDLAEAYNNMGNALQNKGNLEEAIKAFNKAISLKPFYADAFYNLGNALKYQRKPEEAIEAYMQAVSIKPDHREAYGNIGEALKGFTFSKPNPAMQTIITSILTNKTYVRPKDICHASLSLLKFETSVSELFEKYSDCVASVSFQELLIALCELPLFLKLMSVCPIADLGFETVLTDIRANLLSSISAITENQALLRFQSALALQCFTNEYVYVQTDVEVQDLEALEALVKKTFLKGEQPNKHFILCLAAYKPLHRYDWCALLTATSEIGDVFTRQVIEPQQEMDLKSNIPVLGEISNTVSSKVREQYEESPYPRWVNLGLPLKPFAISKVVKRLNLRVFDHATSQVDAPDILIAGCGTGQHSIGTATRFKNSRVLAIDLSLSSLAYAKRKTEELGITNIEYMQADILDLGKLGRQFNIVESAGVLHHMADPIAGWLILTDCLKKGGLMRIGLYSELAREHIVAMRQEISQLGIGSSDTAMRSFRGEVINSDKDHHKLILQSNDFYSLSTFRDLLFHFQEHRFTIDQIKDCLAKLGLEFCGFEADSIIQTFKRRNNGLGDPYDLNKWNTHEKANPKTFKGMYQFWCQKLIEN